MKVQSSVQFPTFTEADRGNVRKYLTEFDRIARHCAGGSEMEPGEWCSMLISSCPRDSTAGKKLRGLQEHTIYQAFEQKSRLLSCQVLLRNALMNLQKGQFTREVGAVEEYDAIKFELGDDILDFHTRLDNVIMELEAQKVGKDDHTLYLDYQKKMGDRTALGAVLRQSKPQTYEELRKGVEEYFDVHFG